MKAYNTETGEVQDLKSLPVAYFWWFFLGLLGAHWFYLGKPGRGVLYLLTVGIFGLGWLVDMFNMPDYVRHSNFPS